MELPRKVLYNLLRSNWLIDPELEVSYWQVEDYRTLSLETIFKRLAKQQIQLDSSSFIAYAEGYSSPEELAEDVLDETDDAIEEQDKAYLLIFELWRRLVPEKLCLSIFCDELDFQINLYDSGEMENTEGLQTALADLQNILDENIDRGISPQEAFISISECCAVNLEDFIYDFTADQIDAENDNYALELIDGFYLYVQDKKWFDFLKARVMINKDLLDGHRLLRKLIEQTAEDEDVQFNLEVLSSMIESGEHAVFVALVQSTLDLLELEEDFQELLTVCADYYQRLDYDWEEKEIQKILDQRQARQLETEFEANDPHKAQFFAVIQGREL